MKTHRWIFLPLVFLCGCARETSVVPGFDALKSFILEQLLDLTLTLVKWTVLGGLAGLAVGVGGYFLLKRLGAYDWQWRPSRWFRWATFAMMVVVCPLLFAVAGFFQGVLRGSEILLREGPLATRVFPVIGDAGADILMGLHLLARKLPDAAVQLELPTLSGEEIHAFRQGRTELDVVELRENIRAVADRSTDRLLASLNERVLEQYPGLKDGMGQKALDLLVNQGGRWLLVRKAQDPLKQAGFGHRAETFYDGLAAAAARGGDPRTISHRELSAFLVERAIVGGALWQVRVHVRSQQFPLLGICAGVILLPVPFFRGAEWIRRRRVRRTDPPG